MAMEEIDILSFINYYISKIKYVLLSILILVILGNAYYALTRVPLYKSSTTIILVSKNTTTTNYTQTDLNFNKNLTKTYSEIIKSRNVLSNVISQNNLNYTYKELYNMITVSAVEDTELLKISVSSADPSEAMIIANSIVPVFSQEVQNLYYIDNVGVVDSAVTTITPYNINYLKENIIFAILGFILSSGIIFVIFYFDTSIKSSEIIEEKYKLTLLGNVPNVSKD